MKLVLSAWLLQNAIAAPESDLVKSLPGWDGEPISRTYSGYISAGVDSTYTLHEHYLFFESENDPKNDPVIMWTNGGPGAPSFFGSFTELGPYYLSDASLVTEEYNQTGIPSLFQNIFSWTKQGNLLIRNLPPPVGYSYCDPAGPSGDGYSCGSWDDTRTAKHSYEFLKNWFDAFPEFSNSELYLTGESYAGIYVPTLAREILKNTESVPARQLRGIAIGDGVTGSSNHHGPLFSVEFWYGHGQFSTKTYNEIQAACSQDELYYGVQTHSCRQALDKMEDEKGYSFGYGLYDECYDFDLGAMGAMRWDADRPFGKLAGGYQPHFMDGAPCGGTGALNAWAKHSAVKSALHVASNANYFSGDNGVGFDYRSNEPDESALYKHFALETDLRVLIYNGDADPSLNSFRGENFTRGIGLQEIEAWRPWTADGKMRMGGYVTRYEGNLDYLTIRGAGHMVPEYKPQAASAFLSSWLKNEEYPRLQRTSKAVI